MDITDNNNIEIAAKNARFISLFFALSYFKSKDPSNTISINPTVPKAGKIRKKSNVLIFNLSTNKCNPIPKSSNKSTDGSFVLLATRSNKYENITNPLKIIKVV